ncbi:helix-turn-helix domain-containing protein [Actinomyces sp. 186855]|nr:helix-turn-helix domain-containing protein [Actinomyces sp. AC-20-1]MCL3790672.1 helix-turn-helix domain-containing protein [Actinomyces sp. 187325]MCL3792979.1 helix-turn-helix domain-containing protein [Actinomyces sp. 186855]MCL3795401.1 helix-turn-helix domain-containing protein [Actinomyces sp. 217892]
MYYAQGETMEVIARHLGVSRSTVSRLLARARDEGVVRIELREPGAAGSLERHLLDEHGVRARIVHVREGTTEIHRLQQVAAVAATTLTEMIDAEAAQAGTTRPDGPAAVGHDTAPDADGGLVVGVAWGTTMGELGAALPTRRVPGLTLVQLNGASDPLREGPSAGDVLSRMGQCLGARTIAFPVPAFFDQVATRRAMWSERSVKRVLAVAERARIAVFGVGSLSSELPSQVYSGGHLTRADLAVARREEVVGDVCTVLLRADGTWRDIDLNARATGPTPAQLARVPRRLCVVAGTGKARAALAALRARVATDLVIDGATARAVLALSHRQDHRKDRT